MNRWAFDKFKVDLRAFARGQVEPLLWLKEMGGVSSWKKPRVFSISYPALGDHWVSLCHFVRFCRASGGRHLLNLPEAYGRSKEHRTALVQEIGKVLQCDSEIEFSDQPPELQLPVHPARNGKTVMLPGCLQTKRSLVAYQFDGVSHAHLNPTEEEIKSFLGCFPAVEVRKVGMPLTLAESMEVLSRAKLFIGVSSGMSHLAASANTPALLYMKFLPEYALTVHYYKHFKRWNPYPRTRFFSNLNELKSLLRNYL